MTIVIQKNVYYIIFININILHDLARARNNNYYKITYNNIELSTI